MNTSKLSILVPLTLSFAFCGCAAVQKAEDLISALDAKVDAIAAKANAGIDEAKGAVHTVAAGVETVKGQVSALDDKLNETANALEAKGAPIDQGAVATGKWLVQNPSEISSGAIALVAAMAAMWQRKKKKDSIAAHEDTQAQLDITQSALSASAKAIEGAAPEIKAKVMEILAKNSPEHDVIMDAKKP